MLKQWRDGRLLTAQAATLYVAVAEAAREPQLYAEFGVADSVDGRLEMLVLHLVLVMDRVRRIEGDGGAVARALGEAFVEHMDDTMRAIGVGDLTVPRKVKKAAAALYEAHQEYGLALAADGDATAAWQHALQLRLSSRAAAPAADIVALSAHAGGWLARLRDKPDAAILAGLLR